MDGSAVLERTIQPLRVAFSFTIHKSQSLTLSKAKIELGKSEKPFSLTYFALSRVRRLEDLLLTHVGVERFRKIKTPHDIKEYLKLTLYLCGETKKRFSNLI